MTYYRVNLDSKIVFVSEIVDAIKHRCLFRQETWTGALSCVCVSDCPAHNMHGGERFGWMADYRVFVEVWRDDP